MWDLCWLRFLSQLLLLNDSNWYRILNWNKFSLWFMIIWSFCFIFMKLYKSLISNVAQSPMSVGWDVKWCPLSKITNPFACLRPFHLILMKCRLVRAARETSKFHNWLLKIWCTTQSNQLINQSYQITIAYHRLDLFLKLSITLTS